MKSPKQEKRARRSRRIRAKVHGTASQPRLSVYRSGRHTYAQIINDDKGVTLAASNDIALSGTKTKKTKLEVAKEVGKELAKAATAKKIEKVVFDRGGFLYAGRVKAVADGAREGGLKF